MNLRPILLDSILDCEIGVTRLFGMGDITRDALVSGWSEPEDGHVWNDGFDAVLAISLPSLGRPAHFSLVGEPFITEDVPAQDLTVYMNGYRLGFWRMTTRAEMTLEVKIQAFQILEELGRARLEFTFHLPLSVRPSEIIASADQRLLGFCFRKFTIS